MNPTHVYALNAMGNNIVVGLLVALKAPLLRKERLESAGCQCRLNIDE